VVTLVATDSDQDTRRAVRALGEPSGFHHSAVAPLGACPAELGDHRAGQGAAGLAALEEVPEHVAGDTERLSRPRVAVALDVWQEWLTRHRLRGHPHFPTGPAT